MIVFAESSILIATEVDPVSLPPIWSSATSSRRNPTDLWVADITYIPTLGGVSLARGDARRVQPQDGWVG